MPDVEQSVLYMKVTDSLRESDPSKLAELAKTYNIQDFPLLLSLAVELSPLETVQWVCQLYESRGRDFNEVDPKSGDTALHKAIAYDRAKVVRELMLNPRVDDTIRNHEGLTAPDTVSTPEMESVVSAAENKFAEQMSVKLKLAFKNHDVAQLEKIYENPRVSVILNINGIDPHTGTTVLHDSAKSNDVQLVRFILAHGGDPLIRDKFNRKLPEELTTNDEIRKALSQSAKSKAILDQTHGKPAADGKLAAGAPAMEGYLKKWTNITSGYKLRWFVLKKGELSYYKHPEDAKAGERHIRGSIGLRHAAVKLDSSEKNKFEIRTPSTRFHLKASHPAETNKWVWALQNAITSVRDEEKAQAAHQRHTRKTSQVSNSDHRSRASLDQPRSGAATAGVAAAGAGAAGAAAAGASHTTAGPATRTLSRQSNDVSISSPVESTAEHHAGSNGSTRSINEHRRANSLTGSSYGDNWLVNDLNVKGDEDESDEDYADEAALSGPHISAESLIARLSAIKDLMTMLVFQVHDETMRDAITTAQGSIDVLSSDIVMFQRQSQAQIHKYKVELERSDKAQRSWAANYRDLELQCVNLEGQLHALRGDTRSQPEQDEDEEFFDTYDHVAGDSPQKPRGTESNNPLSRSSEHHEPVETIPEEPEQGNTAPSGAVAGAAGAGAAGAAGAGVAGAGAAGSEGSGSAEGAEGAEGTEDTNGGASGEQSQESKEKSDAAPEADTELSPAQNEVATRIEAQKSFAGYEDPPRKKLALDADNRPKLSLWGILKNLIGKDMTKMTLPVTFNECTSLLQRSAEDMEYVSLLDRAAEAIDDGGLRMAFVAAFAGSSYSSTINRIAKPFNPLLGETYEYARPDLGYRLFAEQVSHHPPIGALMAEAKTWDFYGESNVESKFYGRSFDINPLGLWYVNLRPNKGADVEEELYSFRKLTSSVVGIMLGNPVVDNYGDMHIKNHTTGINAVIHYKARGWRGSSAYKLEGEIHDKSGKLLWTISGQWNDKIFAKKAGSDERKLLWQCHPRHKVPFNLTDFAITLNALPERLKPWLPPTDTRLRPDQRAMEEGRYDDASDEKSRVEDKQREKRRERETKGIEYRPQWFKLEKHPVTGLNYYKPINNYWEQRKEHNLGDKGDIF